MRKLPQSASNPRKLTQTERDFRGNFRLDRRGITYHRLATAPSELTGTYAEEVEEYKQYYSPEVVPRVVARALRGGARVLCTSCILVILFIFFCYKFPPVQYPEPPPLQPKSLDVDLSNKTTGMHRNKGDDEVLPSMGIPNPSSNECIKKYRADILDDKSPENVNKVKPHQISVIASIGDSLTIGSRSVNTVKEFSEQERERFPGNTYFSGADGGIEQHFTIHNLLYVLGTTLPTYKLIGGSHGKGMESLGFDVAVGGTTIEDFPRQAAELAQKIASHPQVRLQTDWKLVSVFFGTNDLGTLGNRPDIEPIIKEKYKEKLEEGLEILKDKLPRTIVSIVAMFQPQLLIDAQSLIDEGKRPGDETRQKAVDSLCVDYQNAAFEVQSERKFDTDDFTVVVQPFAVDIKDAFRNKSGDYDKAFYAWDEFHFSKLANALVAKALWRNLVEPVGTKTTKADLSNVSPNIACLDPETPYIRTLGNSQ